MSITVTLKINLTYKYHNISVVYPQCINITLGYEYHSYVWVQL